MNNTFKHFLGRNLHNSKGWETKRKIVVIESDDWGTIRMPSLNVYEKLLKRKINVDSDEFTKYDSLASEDDLEMLFEVLYKHKDRHNNPAVVTANTIVANPDFKKIEDSNFKDYFYEPFTETLKKYSNHSSSFKLWKQGISNQIFYPQLHGREHLNVSLWFKHLKNNEKTIKEAFELEMFGLPSKFNVDTGRSYMAAFDYDTLDNLDFIKKSITDAQKIFNDTFGYKSKSFIAPNYIWSDLIEEFLLEVGIKYIQSSRYQLLPKFNKLKGNQNLKHYLGETNKNSQIYLVRNCIFEPSLVTSVNPVENTLKQIKTSFFWNKPAIISSHRLNYIGFLDENNRNKNLQYLDTLLSKIINKWPDVEFLTSNELGEIIELG